MSAYAILDLKVFDKEKLQDYQQLAPVIIKKFGGKIIVRGGESTIVEGSWDPERLVIIEFPSFEVAKAWSSSEEYKKAKIMRQKGAEANIIIVEGVDIS